METPTVTVEELLVLVTRDVALGVLIKPCGFGCIFSIMKAG
ncbi:hypothetical protein [Methanobacterium sp.]|nr:hypothetical protein [Methanobacterium sp.]MDY9923441.1 hypothetical protein [Methanobacterium sp.]